MLEKLQYYLETSEASLVILTMEVEEVEEAVACHQSLASCQLPVASCQLKLPLARRLMPVASLSDRLVVRQHHGQANIT